MVEKSISRAGEASFCKEKATQAPGQERGTPFVAQPSVFVSQAPGVGGDTVGSQVVVRQ